jgi:ssDNA-binding Zn-finger/Zn-ribbon topoisomerase 1
VARQHDPDSFVERRGIAFVVVWKGDIFDTYATRKSANIALWKLKKVHATTGAEPIRTTALERVLDDDILETKESRPNPEREFSGLVCPDCGARLLLKSGKFGLFYGCEMYRTTLCRGSVNADSRGIPTGVPAPMATRRARYTVYRVLEHLHDEEAHDILAKTTPKEKVGQLSHEQCAQFLAELYLLRPDLEDFVKSIPDHIQRTRWERLAADNDRLDQILGPLGVDHEGP